MGIADLASLAADMVVAAYERIGTVCPVCAR
jgi:hypothetical protein